MSKLFMDLRLDSQQAAVHGIK